MHITIFFGQIHVTIILRKKLQRHRYRDIKFSLSAMSYKKAKPSIYAVQVGETHEGQTAGESKGADFEIQILAATQIGSVPTKPDT